MQIEFDSEKDETNRAKHGLSLADAVYIDLDTAEVIRDDRQSYGETRYRAYGLIGARLHMLAFTMRGDTLRAISLRKANTKETKRHGR